MFCLSKIGTAGYEVTEEKYALLRGGIAALRRDANRTVTAQSGRKALLEHPQVKEAVSYWQEALDVVVSAAADAGGSQVSNVVCICGCVGAWYNATHKHWSQCHFLTLLITAFQH